MTAWRVRIVPDAAADGVAIQIVRRNESASFQLLFAVKQDTRVEPGEAMPRPSLVLHDDLGRALLDALAEHYGGASPGRQQRADFEHERRRVDRLTDALITITTKDGD